MEQATRLSPAKLVLTSVLEPKDELNEVCFTSYYFNISSAADIDEPIQCYIILQNSRSSLAMPSAGNLKL